MSLRLFPADDLRGFSASVAKFFERLVIEFNATQKSASDSATDLGNRGAFIEAIVAENTVTGWATGVVQNITSLSLPAGDWDVCGVAQFGNGAVTGTQSAAGISLVSATMDQTIQLSAVPLVPTGSADIRLPVISRRVVLTTAAIVYLVGRIDFTGGTPKTGGYLRARYMGPA